MQVMNNDQFVQKEVLIGGSGKTISAKVSDDPILMSMLSTGFYANPHRAMIQEVMFNAWDAHRMGKCQDTPIDIYVNENSGFVVRDYGPGIHNDDMENVYCTYAASTKRDDEDQTGGFGLGSKSPWAYTESFTVTSHHKGIKTMYLMSRVSDEANGKPGMTPLMSFETEETGLSVAIPLETGSLIQTRKLVNDVLYLSGIKANFHYEDRDPVLIESQSVAPAQYVLDSRTVSEHDDSMQNLYAVYGGVRYAIPNREEYKDEYEFMDLISDIAPLYIGFASHTLSPLPNREGLNMSTNTKDNIRIGLELCMERFKEVFNPVIHAYFRDRFDQAKEQKIQSHFALYKIASEISANQNFLNEFKEKMLPLVPVNTDPTVWEIALKLLTKSTETIVNIVGKETWRSILVKHFIRCYPNDKQLGFSILKEPIDKVIGRTFLVDCSLENTLSSITLPTQLTKLYEFEQKLSAEFPDDKILGQPKLRLRHETDWQTMERHRNAPKGLVNRYVKKSTRPIVGAKVKPPVVGPNFPDRIWSSKDGDEVNQFLLSDYVILAKSVSALKETNTSVNSVLGDKTSPKNHHTNGAYHVVPAYVIHSRKGAYDKAKEILTNLGYQVYEAKEPEKNSKSLDKKTSKPIKQYCRLNPANNRSTWQAWEIDPSSENYIPEKHGVPLIEPKYYLYLKQSDITQTYYYSSSTPRVELVKEMLKIEPDIAMVNNQSQADVLEKQGVIKFEELVKTQTKNMTNNVYRFRNIIRVIKAKSDTSLPFEMIQNNDIQSALGIAKVKQDDVSFWDEVYTLQLFYKEEWRPVKQTMKEVKKKIEDTWSKDPQKNKILKAFNVCKFLHGVNLNYEWMGLNEKEQTMFASKIARFIRTT